ncbi:hypothetical protein EV363DRAFT_1178416 [Boletus edulis]|nr:hypothetical protein EV363DRAFT_1178416 [Boletus edulis]
MVFTPDRKTAPPLDPNLYELDAESLTFFKSVTGIHDEDELKEHVLDVQRQAYGVVPYPCIRGFSFTRVTISKAPVYSDVLKLGQERPDALFLDIGCGFGNDARKAALDGFPDKQIVASDLRRELWDLGHALFCSNPKSFPATFLAGDIVDPAFLSPLPIESNPLSKTKIDLSRVSTLNDLHGQVSAIWASSFFHMFSEKEQQQVARALASLLSPEPGSVVFGAHVALPSKGLLTGRISDRNVDMFCHDPESWKAMWVGRSAQGAPSECTTANANGAQVADDAECGVDSDVGVFAPESVNVDAKLVSTKCEGGDRWLWIMVWSVTRL